MLVGVEKKNYGLEESHVGPRQERVVNAGHDIFQDVLKISAIIPVPNTAIY